MNEKSKKRIILILSILIILALSLMFWIMPKVSHDKIDVKLEKNETICYDHEIKLFDDNKKINPDFVAQLTFKSGVINLPVVQSQLEDTYAAYDQYLRTAWDTMEYDEEGSIFMDPNVNYTNDENIVVYGHYVYPYLDPEQTHKFSPLHLLKDQMNYAENKEIQMVFENEIKTYEVAYVYYANIITNEEGQTADVDYMLPNYAQEEFDEYLSKIKAMAFYDTNVEINNDDRILTLQTCVENRDDLRLIVVAKEIACVKMR